MKTVIAVISISALAEIAVYQGATHGHSEVISGTMLLVAVVGAILSGAFAPRRFMAFCGSSASFAPVIAYSTLGHGGLEMGGILHAMVSGMMGVGWFVVFHGRRGGTCSGLLNSWKRVGPWHR